MIVCYFPQAASCWLFVSILQGQKTSDMIAFLGTGLLGSNFTRALLEKGNQVQVWNRTAEKARALEKFGARAFELPSEAVANVERVHVTLSDDTVVDEVLNQASPGFAPGLIVIDHTTTSVAGAVERTKKWAEKGITYVHVPVFMGPINALQRNGYMLISGNQEVAARVTPWLSEMTGKVLNFGEETGRAAAIKLMGNSFLLSLTSGLSDMLALGKAMGVPSDDIFTLFSSWNPGALAPDRLRRILSAHYDNPSWELQMARKDARLMINEAQHGNSHLIAIPAIAKEMDKWLAKGFANKDWTIIASENL